MTLRSTCRYTPIKAPWGKRSDNRRGASSQRDASRLDYTLTHMTEDEAALFGIGPDDCRDYVRLDRAKANIVRRSIKASWFHMASVPLGNASQRNPDGDDVQAIETWTPPDTWEGMTGETIVAILGAIDAGMSNGRRYSAATNINDRAVWPVFGQHCPGRSEAQCREIINQWLKSGVLYIEDYPDPVEGKIRKDSA